VSFLRGIYRFDYMGHKFWWFTISGIIIGAGLVSLFVRGGGDPLKGLNYGLEFKEGTRLSVALVKPATVADVRATIDGLGYGPSQVQQVSQVGSSKTPGFQIQVETLAPADQAKLKAALDKDYTIATENGTQLYESQTVGATFGKEVVTASYKAIAIALLLILIYVSLRFQWKFAVGAIGAEIHDLLVVVGIYSLTWQPVTTATVAAVLTILGYSLYDTVIVFDRIRENAPKLSRLPYGDMVNRSIWEVMTRSINTTMIVLLPVVCLLLFGGSTLKDFAFALLVGILSGAYSSIFVASPILTILKEREPQHRRAAARAEEA
jgi:SecD/SecF fusion protein